ncbi:MAG TPA: putative toxin-antitoxin system toxin component, PIN family [Geminicoccaceae bacterium]|nr:putative toxin-antitoxin system toxin component, PIN family [Geminicoccaceae bacterium]
MTRAVLDSSVLVSAFVTPRGQVAGLLRAPARSHYRLWLSEPILAETGRTLLAKRSLRRHSAYTDEDVQAYLGWLLAEAEMAGDLPTLRVVPDDPEDDVVVATAVAARADYLVTGDRRHLLPLGSYQGIRVVTPRQFLDLL